MKFKEKLLQGTLVKRYKRFFIDIKYKNKIITSHCPNSGSMMGLLDAGNKIWFSTSDNPKRQLKYTLEIIEVKNEKVGINTFLTNKIVLEALNYKKINSLIKFNDIKTETKFSDNTRFDFLLTNDKEKCFELLLKITSQARQYGITIRLDMEDFSVTQDTIDMCLRIWKKNPNIGIALQSNLYRTVNDLPILMSRGISIRLIKGAYKEDITKSYQQNNLKVKSFLRLAQTLLSNNGKSYFHFLNNVKHAIGTHDETIIKSIKTQLPVFKVKPTDFQFELLYGIRRDISFSLLKEGYNVTLYIPFGEEWLPYTLRRLREFKNLRFVIFNILKELFSGNRQKKPTR